MVRQSELFPAASRAKRRPGVAAPLAERLRPRSVAELVGQHHLLAEAAGGPSVAFSSVLQGVKELRGIIDEAERELARSGHPTVLFVDEIHRFNKAQQDAFLPHVEAGTIVLIGATTENPSFEVIAPLLSRTRVLVLEPLGAEDVGVLVDRALVDRERGLGAQNLTLEPTARAFLLDRAQVDDAVP